MDTTTHRGARRSLLAPAAFMPPLVLLAALAIPALGSRASHAAAPRAAIERITIKASAVHLPAQIPAGMLALTLVNDTRLPASAGVGRANPGATEAAINTANAASNTPQGFLKLIHLLTFLGGPDSVSPGGKETTILDFRTPGHYGLDLSLGQGEGSQDHVTTFTVMAGSGQAGALPAIGIPILLKEMKFVGLPRTVSAGTVTFKLTNTGLEVHEMVLARLDPGKTRQDVANLFKGPQQGPGGPPPWAHVVGGLNSLSGHQTAYLTVTLTPGTYAALCLMPDTKAGPKQGMPHAAEGMLTTFTVR